MRTYNVSMNLELNALREAAHMFDAEVSPRVRKQGEREKSYN
jgi:hypothetical protein